MLMLLSLLVVNLQDVRKSLGELREGLTKIRKELTEYFTDVEQNDRYGKQMWSFAGKASAQLEDLVDDVNHAESTFSEVVSYYGEDEKSMTSAEFYGVFKTFVTSYKVHGLRNRAHDHLLISFFFRNAKQTIRVLQRSAKPSRRGKMPSKNPEPEGSNNSRPRKAMKTHPH